MDCCSRNRPLYPGVIDGRVHALDRIHLIGDGPPLGAALQVAYRNSLEAHREVS